MLKSHKYRLLPNDDQKAFFQKVFGCTRFVYNVGLETRKTAYESAQKTLSCVELINQLPELKEVAPWLSDCPSQALQMSLRNLDMAFSGFFRGKGYPRFKNRHSKQSFQLPQGVKVDREGGKIFLPKAGWVLCILHRAFEGTIKTVTVSKTATGKYFVSVLVENQDQVPAKRPIAEGTTIGVDFGIKSFLTLSDGRKVDNPQFLRRSLRQLRIAQRTLSRRHRKGAKEQTIGYQKQRMVVARLHERIANQRRDFLHKVSTELIRNYDTICLEDLNVRGMMQNGKLALAIGEMGWNEFEGFLKYKADWYGKNVVYVGRFEPTSKRCSGCGSVYEALTLKDRNWGCPICGKQHDRDVNAAVNIKSIGLRNEPLSAKSA